MGTNNRHGGDNGAGAKPVNMGAIQAPGRKVGPDEFIRTTDPNKMSRRQRRYCDSKIDRVREERGLTRKKPF